MKRSTCPRKMLRFESLEPRRLLAGNVTVEIVKGGLLSIAGDELDNQFKVEWVADDGGLYKITALDDTTSVIRCIGTPWRCF